ncbi:MAG: ABC transporter permease subunit [Oscillospiraceae bacterium]|jgi:ABC-2 type transport system permease protein|nr:ABC transporter permease subunit [Oscillospiraceae bacterium]
MFTIFKKEFESYFFSAIGYMVLTFLFLIGSLFFFISSVIVNNSSLIGTFSGFFSLTAFFSPIITMRLFSEERNKKTDQVLLTAPVKISSIIAGKYLAATALHVVSISVTLIYAFVISKFSSFDWPVFFASFFGMVLVGSAFISVGMFFSSLTESQVVAVVVTLVFNVLILMLDGLLYSIPFKFLTDILKNFSFTEHFLQSFPLGMIKFKDVVFFLSVSAVFIFLTSRAIEKRRWS